jgi:hypothetical protein
VAVSGVETPPLPAAAAAGMSSAATPAADDLGAQQQLVELGRGVLALALTLLPPAGLLSSLLAPPAKAATVPASATLAPLKIAARSRVTISNGGLSQLPYIAHWVVLTAVAVAVVNVQVATRFVAACPPVYWAMAGLWEWGRQGLEGAAPEGAPMRAAAARLLRRLTPWLLAGYCLGYTAIGTALFSSFYNWT